MKPIWIAEDVNLPSVGRIREGYIFKFEVVMDYFYESDINKLRENEDTI